MAQMRGKTLIQFPSQRPEDIAQAAGKTSARAIACGTCGQSFSTARRFCPFDGQALGAAEASDRPNDPLVGTVIDNRYNVDGVVGEGAMGVVYAVSHTALGRRFALKALRRDLSSDSETAARFIQEARTAALLQHRGLIEITDFGRLASGQAYFVMEYLDGQQLSHLLQDGLVRAWRAIEIVRQVADALSAAHQRGVIHGNLKPDNIHVAAGYGIGERVKILDFGSARVAGASRLTLAGMPFGTAHYMSPEQATGSAADHRSDIYALGVVMYELFTGRVPFDAYTHTGLLAMHLNMSAAPPSSVRPALASLGRLDAVILRCLEKAPANRYASLQELLIDLEEIARLTDTGREGTRADRIESQSDAELDLTFCGATPPSRPSWPKVVVVAVGFVASIGVAFAFRPKHDTRIPMAMTAAALLPVTAAMSSGGADHAPAVVAGHAGTQASPELSAAAIVAHASQGASGTARTVHVNSTLRSSSPRTPARRFGRSEIVDPWAK